MDDGCQRSDFSPGLPVTIPRSHRPGFFLSLFRCRRSVTIPQTRSVRLWYSYWRPSLKYLKKKNGLTDCSMATGVKKNPAWQTEVWPLELLNSVWPLAGLNFFLKFQNRESFTKRSVNFFCKFHYNFCKMRC